MSNKGQKASFGQSMTSFVGAVLLILSIRWALFEPYVIPSGSMIPSLLVHDHIIVNKLAFGVRVPFTKEWLWRFAKPHRGDVIVFRAVDDADYFMIKRVIGLPGEEVEVTPAGLVQINGVPLATEILPGTEEDQGSYYKVNEGDLQGRFERFDFLEEQAGERSYRIILGREAYRFPYSKTVIPEGHYFMMGDNRDNSKDSRYWGPLPQENILGRATYVWLTCEETISFLPFLCNPLKIRWKRLIQKII